MIAIFLPTAFPVIIDVLCGINFHRWGKTIHCVIDYEGLQYSLMRYFNDAYGYYPMLPSPVQMQCKFV